jgi:hypothetical protein
VAFGPGRSAGTASRLRPAVVGGAGGDYVAQVAGNISQATGSFSHVSPGITENGDWSSSAPDQFSLQLNSNLSSLSVICQAGPNYANGCFFWEQFLYSSSGPDGYPEIFIEDQVFNLGAPCSSIGWQVIPSGGSEVDCRKDSPAAQVPHLTASDLARVTLTGSASATFDSVSLTLGSGSYGVSFDDLGLYGSWNQTEWGVYGDAGHAPLGGADFNAGSYLEADTAFVANTGGAAPNCQYVVDRTGMSGMTDEWNNLSLSTTVTPSPGPYPTVASYQIKGTPGNRSCGTQSAAVPPPAAVAPSISPAAYSVTHLPAGTSTYPCPSGQLCLQVNDPTTSGTTVFDLYYCKTYALSHWYDNGTYIDNQTGGSSTTTYFYGSSTSQVLAQFTATNTKLQTFNWTPVNWIKPC